MPPRYRFPRLNSRFNIKHIRDDLNQIGLKDPSVYSLARKQNRLIITFNGNDFRKIVSQSTRAGVINISANLSYEQIDTKLTSLLIKSSQNALFGRFTDLTGESEL